MPIYKLNKSERELAERYIAAKRENDAYVKLHRFHERQAKVDNLAEELRAKISRRAKKKLKLVEVKFGEVTATTEKRS